MYKIYTVHTIYLLCIKYFKAIHIQFEYVYYIPGNINIYVYVSYK